MRVVIITNMPAPYRIPAWNMIGETPGYELLVIFCSHKEPNRNWNVPGMSFRHIFLKENYHVKKDGLTYVHNNRDVWKHLKKFNPDVVITGGFNPTMLYAFMYCVTNRKKHIPMSDAWKLSEQHLSILHGSLRKLIFRFSHAFIACSIKGKQYYRDFNIDEKRIFISHYSIINEAFTNSNAYTNREYDLLFSAQFVKRKNPYFFIEVAALIHQKRSNLKILLLGDGPLKENMISLLQQKGIDYTYPGYTKQEALPYYYSHAKLFLFPTEYDAWGVVAHEALAAGTPVLVTPFAGCSGELVIDGHNGYILNPDKTDWAEKCLEILSDQNKWAQLSSNAYNTTSRFTAQEAANSLLEACNFAVTTN